MVERREQQVAFLKRPKTVQSNGVESLGNVSLFAVLRRVAVRVDEALYLLERRDDPLLARRWAALLFRLSEFRQLLAQLVQLGFTHSAPQM
jgi:hypothetical protein